LYVTSNGTRGETSRADCKSRVFGCRGMAQMYHLVTQMYHLVTYVLYPVTQTNDSLTQTYHPVPQPYQAAT